MLGNCRSLNTNLMKTKYPYSSAKWIFVSDSYGNFGWIEGFVEYLNLSNFSQLVTGSSGFTKSGIYRWSNMLNTLDPDPEVDFIICGGGYNDAWSNDSEFNSAVSEFMNIANTKFPNAKVYVGLMGWSSNVELQAYMQMMIYLYNRYIPNNGAVLVPNLWKFLHIYPRMNSDMIHPADNSQGNLIGKMFANAVAGGYSERCYYIRENKIVANSPWMDYQGNGITYVEMSEYLVRLYITSRMHWGRGSSGDTWICDGNHKYTFGHISPLVLRGSGDASTTTGIIVQSAEGIYYQGTCTISVDDCDISVSPFILANNNYLSAEVIDFQINACIITSSIYHI